MSFDLAVWPEASTVTAEEATRKYFALTALEPGALPAGPRAVAFHRELTARYPEPSALPDSPWSAEVTVLGDAVLMSMGCSTPGVVVAFVRELAERHGFVLYDPRDGAVYSPPALRGEPAVVLSACDGSRVENPGAARIEAALARLSAGNWFVVLDRGDHYVQVGFGERAATRRGWFALEHREGLPHRHFRAEVAERSRIVRAFTGFATGDDSWRLEFDWQRTNF
ncbi:hypothetical protein [Amycolatopsis sp. MtRt-6]|uniref:hypothetical protein n=1 Tax=Amycolatopsis sp. MtRt-6 TaxID=2792782 RepID=UPI001A8C4A2E|nr:hypothetical protein [Amycolatopsis sp. MtRt-6]